MSARVFGSTDTLITGDIATVPFDSQRYEISDDDGSLILDFATSTRTAD